MALTGNKLNHPFGGKGKVKEMNKELINATETGICNALNELCGENSPMPEFRAAWLKSTENIAARFVAGVITKAEMKAEYDAAKASLVRFAFLVFLKDDNEISDEIKHEIYEECKRRVLAA